MVKKQLVIDLTHVEVALTPICPLNQEVLRFLRGFKKLLEMSPEDMKASNLIGSVIPDSYVIHLLVMQTNGQIRAPHTVRKLKLRINYRQLTYNKCFVQRFRYTVGRFLDTWGGWKNKVKARRFHYFGLVWRATFRVWRRKDKLNSILIIRQLWNSWENHQIGRASCRERV